VLAARAIPVSLLMVSCLLGQLTSEQAFENAVRLQKAGKWTEAEQSYHSYLNRFGATPEALANLGAVLVQRERFPEAVQAYGRALQLAPEVLPIRLNLGLAYFKSGQPGPAAEQFGVILGKQPGNRQALQLRAMCLLELERFADAARDYAALMPSADVNVRLGLASAYLRLDRAAEAKSLIEPLFETDSAQVKLLLGQILIENGQLDEAKKVLERAAELDPKLPTVRLNLGAAYWRQQDTAAAIAEWRKELRAHPGSFQAHYTLGAALALTSPASGEASPLLRRALALKPGNAMAPYQLAKLIWRNSKGQEAISLLQRSIRWDPNYREAHYLLASIYQSLGRKAEAAKEFAEVRRISQESLQRSEDLFESAR
jgi:predicted Zn-dependent protease